MTDHSPDAPRPLRRSFLERVAALGAGLALAGLPTSARAQGGVRAHARGAGAPAEPSEHDAWMDGLRGTHRHIVDAPALGDGRPLLQTRNFLDAYRDAYRAPEREVSVALGVHGSTTPIVFRDAIWERFRLGEHFRITDPATGAPATRNVYANVRPGDPVPADAAIDALQRRGVVVNLCNTTLGRVAGPLAAAGRGTPAAVRAALLDARLPGVVVVPAMIVALSRAKVRGFS
jgi:hypothetical protein